jgi:hypothetical protein
MSRLAAQKRVCVGGSRTQHAETAPCGAADLSERPVSSHSWWTLGNSCLESRRGTSMRSVGTGDLALTGEPESCPRAQPSGPRPAPRATSWAQPHARTHALRPLRASHRTLLVAVGARAVRAEETHVLPLFVALDSRTQRARVNAGQAAPRAAKGRPCSCERVCSRTQRAQRGPERWPPACRRNQSRHRDARLRDDERNPLPQRRTCAYGARTDALEWRDALRVDEAWVARVGAEGRLIELAATACATTQ